MTEDENISIEKRSNRLAMALVKSWYKEPGIKEINYGNLIVRNVSRYDVPEFSAIDYIIKAAKR